MAGDNQDRLQQKDLDALWVKKYGINYYSYKNSICIDVDHDFTHRYAVTPANVHDSQILPNLLDAENEHDVSIQGSKPPGSGKMSPLSSVHPGA